MAKLDSNKIFQRLLWRRDLIQQRLQLAMEETGAPLAAFDYLAGGLGRYRSADIAVKQAELEHILNLQSITWEELTRPSLSDLIGQEKNGARLNRWLIRV